MSNQKRMVVENFIPPHQLKFIKAVTKLEEGEFFIGKLAEIEETINSMPKTGDNEDEEKYIPAKDQVVYLHYFVGGCDWLISERDIDTDGEGQIQAFGWANLGDNQNAEFGYICIPELFTLPMIQLDLYWTPKTFSQLQNGKQHKYGLDI